MSTNKTFNKVQLDVKFTQATTRANLISEENISISFGKISKYFADLHSQAFTGYTHPTYTAHSSGLYKITVDVQGHITGTANVTASDLPSHTHSYLPFEKVTTAADADTYAANTGWYNWNTTSGTNMPTTNWGILLSKEYPSVQMFLPDTGTEIYLRKKTNASTVGTSWMGITGTAGNTYNLNNITKVEASSTNGKIKVNGTDTTVYTHPSHTTKTSGLYKITVDSLGHVSGTAAVAATDLPAHTHSQYYDSTISRAANTVLAAPNGSNGGATFRKLVAADIPSLNCACVQPMISVRSCCRMAKRLKCCHPSMLEIILPTG